MVKEYPGSRMDPLPCLVYALCSCMATSGIFVTPAHRELVTVLPA